MTLTSENLTPQAGYGRRPGRATRRPSRAFHTMGQLRRTVDAMICCDNCGAEFEPVRTRWLCPYCKFKASCCEGEPQ